jgi:hypothetical protein
MRCGSYYSGCRIVSVTEPMWKFERLLATLSFGTACKVHGESGMLCPVGIHCQQSVWLNLFRFGVALPNEPFVGSSNVRCSV